MFAKINNNDKYPYTIGGGAITNNCGGGGYADPASKEKVGSAIADTLGGRNTFGFGRDFRTTPLIDLSVGFGGAFNENGGHGGLIFLSAEPF